MEPSVVPGLEPPWWRQEAPPDPASPALEGVVDADVAIVGGGYTGARVEGRALPGLLGLRIGTR